MTNTDAESDVGGSFHDITSTPGTFSLLGVPLFTTEELSMSTATSGWLSFGATLKGANVTTRRDADGHRTEALFEGMHLGHYFRDPESYCINAAALSFSPRVTKVAVLGGGCFWGVQEALARVVGVLEATAGYAGDDGVSSPGYEDLKCGANRLVEVVKVEYDELVVGLGELVGLFMTLHDASRFRAAGHRGPNGRYRSFISCEDVAEAVAAVERFREEALDGAEVATEITGATMFTPAELRHQHRHGLRGWMETREWLEMFGRRKPAVAQSASSFNDNMTS